MRWITGELFDNMNSKKKVNVKIEIDNGTIFIKPEGYGDFNSNKGEGCPVMIEIWDKELRVVAWTDINCEDPDEVISLEGARESLRVEE